ncbi:MAG TPA: NAD(P)/FAD-dependent oxidoreductase [Solirubrobacteraceae bacterium]|nr:NAD(P)/FAD-dependent oxidoreductase [Solirubrobacteraceae bacterium]
MRAAIVGSGPNGLAAALTLARAGVSVEVYERAERAGGGCRTDELTLPGFAHDVCSAVHPLLAASPFFAQERLPGVELKTPEIAFAHPLDGDEAVAVYDSVPRTAAELGADERLYRALLGPLVRDSRKIVASSLAPVLRVPRHPLAMARFGALGAAPATLLAKSLRADAARALLAGLAAHSMRPLSAPGTGAFALLLGTLAHSVGWPVVAGGSERIVEGLLAEIEAAGGTVHTGRCVRSLEELPASDCTLLDVAPRALDTLAGRRLPSSYRRALRRFRHGPGVFKLDWALSGPVPWRSSLCRETATLHVGGSFEQIARSEADAAGGRHSEQPFCIAVQPCVLDPSRAPEGKHTFYAYCHVPNGSTVDMTERIESQIERFAPGFRDLILARSSMNSQQLEQYDPNYVGGDINSGAATLRQTIFRPTLRPGPYRTPLNGVYLCSSSTPPGGGVHGMCGLEAARAALRDLRL